MTYEYKGPGVYSGPYYIERKVMENPSVGRVVHYVSYGSPIKPDGSQKFKSLCRAATITIINDDDTVGLAVLNPTGFFFNVSCRHAEPGITPLIGGTYHWPERV